MSGWEVGAIRVLTIQEKSFFVTITKLWWRVCVCVWGGGGGKAWLLQFEQIREYEVRARKYGGFFTISRACLSETFSPNVLGIVAKVRGGGRALVVQLIKGYVNYVTRDNCFSRPIPLPLSHNSNNRENWMSHPRETTRVSIVTL
jgi:hypothetical protein